MKLKKGLIAFDSPDEPAAVGAIEDFLNGMLLAKNILGNGTWLSVIQIAHPEFAKKIKGKTAKKKEDEATAIVTQIVFQRMIDLGAKPVYKTIKKGKKNVKR